VLTNTNAADGAANVSRLVVEHVYPLITAKPHLWTLLNLKGIVRTPAVISQIKGETVIKAQACWKFQN